jgi:hypothetical protein
MTEIIIIGAVSEDRQFSEVCFSPDKIEIKSELPQEIPETLDRSEF